MLPDEILVKIEGPTAFDVSVHRPDGRVIWGVQEVTITYRAEETGTIRVDGVDPDGPVGDNGELQRVSRIYEVALDTPLSVGFEGWALIEQPA